MDKVEYSDLNKFLVSIGLILISIAILAQFFFLKETFGLYIDKELIAKFPPAIIASIHYKERYLLKMQILLPFISCFLFLSGASSLVYGLKRWFSRQSKIDAKFDLETEKIQKELQTMTLSQVVEKVAQEVKETEELSAIDNAEVPPDSSNQQTSVFKYIRVEEEVVDVFQKYGFRNFDVLSNQMVGGQFSIDLMLIAKNKIFYDYIFEIKYFKRRLDQVKIEKAVRQLAALIYFYKKNSNRKAIPVLIVVYSEEVSNTNKILEIRNKIESIRTTENGLENFKMEILSEEQIRNIDIKKIVKLKPETEKSADDFNTP